MAVPSLCYEINFPRNEKIRKRFLLKRTFEMVDYYSYYYYYYLPCITSQFVLTE